MGWDPADDVYRLTVAAYDAAQAVVAAVFASTPAEPPKVKTARRWAHGKGESAAPSDGPRMPDMPWVGKALVKRRRR